MANPIVPTRVIQFVFALYAFLIAHSAYGQFTTILNLPPDPDIGNNQSIGSDSQLNLADGGTIGTFFRAGAVDGTSTNIEVNISGGSVGDEFSALSGSQVNISGGLVGENFDAASGSVVNISGGSVGDGFGANGIFGVSVVNISGGSVGDRFDAANGSEINITGGSVGDSFDAHNFSVVNISGGSVGELFHAHRFSEVFISGGSVGDRFDAISGSEVNISGGSFGDRFNASSGSEVNLSGGEFRLDGVLIGGLDTVGNMLAFYVAPGSVLSGTLADGTPFAFSSQDFSFSSLQADAIAFGTLTLTASALPATGPVLISLPTDTAPLGIRSGQTLVVDNGGMLGDDFNAGWGSVVEVKAGGQVGENLEAVGAQVNVTGGSLGDNFDAFVGSVVNFSGGSVGRSFDAFGGSVVNISGGSAGGGFVANGGSVINISGGSVGAGFHALSGSQVNISGGSVGGLFKALSGSQINISGGSNSGIDSDSGSAVNVSGGEFRLDGELISGFDTVGAKLVIIPPSGSVLSGTLADGTPFAFSSGEGDTFAFGTLTLTASTLPATGPALISLPTDPAPLGVRSGQTLVVDTDGMLDDNFNAGWGSVVEVKAGGQVGDNFEAVGAQVNITGGSVGDDFAAFIGSVVNISGGSFGDYFEANSGSEVIISDGSFGRYFRAFSGSQVDILGGSFVGDFIAYSGNAVNISGGSMGDRFVALGFSVVNISGGSVGDDFDATSNSVVNISGGSVGDDFDARGSNGGSVVNISGGSVGDNFDAFGGSVVNISGGSVGGGFTASSGSEVNVSGGSVGGFFRAGFGSVVNISGGSVGDRFDALSSSVVNISGGSVGDGFNASSGSEVNLLGGEFRLNGELISGLDTVGNMLAFNVPTDSVLSGTLADGTPFAFSNQLGPDTFAFGTLTLTASTLPATGPALISLPTDPAPLGVRSGQTLGVDIGGMLGDNFNAGWGSVVEVKAGGQVGENLEAVGAQVNITGGSVGDAFDAFVGSVVNISGGSVGDFFEALNGSEVNISGGSFGRGFDAFSGSTVNLYGTEFVLDGVDITNTLTLNTQEIIADRDVTLSGLLADGSAFSFDLKSTNFHGFDYFAPGALLTIALLLPGDHNGDGVVNAADYSVWRDNLGGSAPLPGDVTPGSVTVADYDVWKSHFGDTLSTAALDGASVPEPATALLLLTAGIGLCLRHWPSK